jgi:hypothetical protein
MPATNGHLPPHLREVCAILAIALVRLSGDSAEKLVRDAARAAAEPESSLHFVAHQSAHANPTRRAA